MRYRMRSENQLEQKRRSFYSYFIIWL